MLAAPIFNLSNKPITSPARAWLVWKQRQASQADWTNQLD